MTDRKGKYTENKTTKYSKKNEKKKKEKKFNNGGF